MTKLLLRSLFFLIPFLYSIYVAAQPRQEQDCSTTCFSSEVVSAEKISGTCTAYELRVSYSGSCAHALSHYTVAVPCGTIESVWNSENWAQETGQDPTSGLKGFKIDDISGFGEGSLTSFTVKFTLCARDEACASQLSCWQPKVAYKAATCVNYETVVASCGSLKASLEKKDPSCFGALDGSISLTIEQGQEPYTILWSDNSSSELLAGLSAGTYSVNVKDASGAEISLTETLGQPEKISVSESSTPASCNGVADGSIDLTLSGGAGQYTYSWNTGAETEDIQDLTPGQYAVTVTDAENCSLTETFSVGSDSEIQVSGTPVVPDCNDFNGALDLTVSGGAIPYAYQWSNGATEEDLANIAAGLYTVTVSDASGCAEKATFLIEENNTLSVQGSSTPASCNNDPIGTINLNVSGGTEPYQYAWSNNETTKDISGVASGYYTVTVTDHKGCSVKTGYPVSKNTFHVPRVIVQPTCHGDDDGSITLEEPIGGTGPFTYEWLTGETGTALTDLSPGVYSVTVTDQEGCSRTLNSTINDPAEISASAAVSNSECNAEGFFSVDLTVSGGTSLYNYEWSDGTTAEDPAGLESGTHTVLITDTNGCSISKEIVIEEAHTTGSCLIDELETTPACDSENNTLSTSVTDADSYLWSVESTDGSWTVSSSDSPSVVFAAGKANSSATFTLTLEKDGCTKTCAYSLTSCAVEDNVEENDPGNPENEVPGGEEPGGEDPENEVPGDGEPGEDPENQDEENQPCEECFSSEALLMEIEGACRTYEMKVNTNGLCRHELSHWTLAIPCGTVSNYFNSQRWKMEFGQDPTTGLYGLKVDDISHFGKGVDSFTVRFTVCEADGCDLSSWDPTVAYKAGQCVSTETIQVHQPSTDGSVSVYPNPFNGILTFEWNSTAEAVDLQIIDQYGNRLSSATKPTGQTDVHYITFESGGLPRGMYYYRLTVDGKMYQGKISKQ